MHQDVMGPGGKKMQSLFEYYEERRAEEIEFSRVLLVHPVSKGVRYLDHGVLKQVDEDGYLVNNLDSEGTFTGFKTAQQLIEQTYDLGDCDFATRRLEKPPTLVLTPVARAEKILIGPIDDPKEVIAPMDGFVLHTPVSTRFASNHELTSVFNDVAGKKTTHEELILSPADTPPMRGIVVKEDVILLFGARFMACKAGTILSFQKTGEPDENGAVPYALESFAPGLANVYLRRTPDIMSAPQPGKWKPSAP